MTENESVAPGLLAEGLPLQKVSKRTWKNAENLLNFILGHSWEKTSQNLVEQNLPDQDD